MATTKKKTAKIRAVKVESKKPTVNKTRRKTAKAAESAATEREEERAKTLVSKAEFRKLIVEVQELANLSNQNYNDIIALDHIICEIDNRTMWQGVKHFFGRKVW